MKTETGVMVIKDGKAWGETYADGHSICFGWMPVEFAPIHDPRYVKKPTDLTYPGSPDTKELRKGKIVYVERKTTVQIFEEVK